MRHLISSQRGAATGRTRKSKAPKALFLVITSVLTLHNAFSGGSLLGADRDNRRPYNAKIHWLTINASA